MNLSLIASPRLCAVLAPIWLQKGFHVWIGTNHPQLFKEILPEHSNLNLCSSLEAHGALEERQQQIEDRAGALWQLHRRV